MSPKRPRRQLCLAVLGPCLTSGLAWAQPAWPPAPEAPHDARAWVGRSQEAAAHRNYQGTLVVSVNGLSSASRLVHYSDGNQQAERIEWLDGESRLMIRVNEVQHTLWPRSRLAVVESRDARSAFPAVFAAGVRQVLESYEWRRIGRDRVAGLDAEVVLMRARDPLRYSQRLWSELNSGLLLRAEILAPSGQVLESVGFTEVALGVRPQIDALQAPLRQLDNYRVAKATALPVRLEAEGWQLGALPAGFRELHCVRRVLGPANEPNAPVVLQAIYGDGLTHVSVFIEPLQPERHQPRASAPVGATSTLTLRRDTYWITLVGDVPAETLQRFGEALVRRRP
ncbi:MucB/RseB C-terminal domain-containing protein [Ideonella alba]|uniref:MucB/RseB C-terminal domain-containing protein n=1 Tax=Ideonella alba TaxID=2824118 RepID=UPI001FFD3014|nr:MucB/RseB C-terminal domain-containing protein [Ideonella alba]